VDKDARRTDSGRIGSLHWIRPAVQSRPGLGTVLGGWRWRDGTSCHDGRSSSWRRCAMVPRMCRSLIFSVARPTRLDFGRCYLPLSVLWKERRAAESCGE